MYKLLSYPLSIDSPVYGAGDPASIEPVKQIKNGDSCNTYTVRLSNHCGTHIDAPRHFFDNGKPLDQYAIGDLIFEKPYVLERPKTDGDLLSAEDLKGIPESDLLLVRTGFSIFRGQNKYWNNNPGISEAAARHIREYHPGIRAVGIDTISVTAYQNRDEGKKTHRVLLDPAAYNKRPLLLIEDMDLKGELKGLKKVLAVPLYFRGADSMPCTVIGEF